MALIKLSILGLIRESKRFKFEHAALTLEFITTVNALINARVGGRLIKRGIYFISITLLLNKTIQKLITTHIFLRL